MEMIASRAGDDLNLASRKAQESAMRRFQATEWLETIVGPLDIPKHPSEKEFISCLRNGLILCHAVNEVEPGSVPKVVEINRFASQSLTWDSQQPLPAYQFFENVRNFLKAAQGLKLPVFEASVFERDNMEAGSSSKIVDCVLGLKEYNDRKQKRIRNENFNHKSRSPFVMHLDQYPPSQNDAQKLEDLIVKALADHMIDAKENLDGNLLSSIRNRNTDSFKLLRKMLSSTLEEQSQYKFPELTQKDPSTEGSRSTSSSITSSSDTAAGEDHEYRQGADCSHWQVVQVQEKKLLNLKELLSNTKAEFRELQSQLQNDLKQMECQIEELSSSAQGYHKVVQENRTLYNMVQDLKGNIRVYCRIRPAFRCDTKNVIDYIGEDGSLVVMDPSKPNKDGKKMFQFNRVFGPTATQEEVFADTQPLIRSVMDGYNVCIFAYGQTGSGKTHTMCGPSGASRKELGINYLALNDLFDLSNTRKDDVKYELFVQMVEIYNEQVRDLLIGDSASTTKLEIRSCTSENGLSLPDATMHSVKSTTDVLKLMKSGQVNRAVSSTALNNQSSRSHSILTVHVHGKDVNGGTIRSCLHLVDLAGSERVDKSEVTGEGLKEAQYINKSLSCLGDVITALSQKNSYIPYRNSKLTLLLQNSLGGNAKTLMFAHVSPEDDSFGETVSTLKFAQRASSVELGAARLNKESREVIDLKEQIESLKRQLGEKEPQSAQKYSKLEPKSPLQNPKAGAVAMERTPPRPRRLSIETNKLEPKSPMQKPKAGGVAMERTPPRTRRLSIETNKLEPKSPMQKPKAGAVAMERTPPRTRGLSVETKCPPKTPNTGLKNRQVKPLVLPKTPEPQVSIRNEIIISSASTANGKSSHIKKSIRTIRKLINGSEKRIQVKSNAVQSTRRQSLTGEVDGDRKVKTTPRVKQNEVDLDLA